MHPDGRTIFVSARDADDVAGKLGRGRCTYSFDTRRREWRWHRQWALPFRGQGHYDGELDAWVGLRDDGHICSCWVPSRGCARNAAPDWNIGREKLFGKVPMPEAATLTYMGDGRFCVVECVVHGGVDEPEKALGERGGFLLHFTMFGLRYSHTRELQTRSHRATSRIVSKHVSGY